MKLTNTTDVFASEANLQPQRPQSGSTENQKAPSYRFDDKRASMFDGA